MEIEIIRGDITEQRVDAIVNAANRELRAGGGVCGAIHRAAGPSLEHAAVPLGPIETGDAVATDAFRLAPAIRWVIHAVGPVWHGGDQGEADLLASCYRRSLEVADELGAASVAFPSISTGIFGYPIEEAAGVAVRTLVTAETDVEVVRLVAFDERNHAALTAQLEAAGER